MNKIVAYHIASGFPDRLNEQMRQYLKDGWQPLGGPFVKTSTVYQAVVKYEESSYRTAPLGSQVYE